MATKNDLRKQFLADRKALSAEEVERRSQAIAELLYRGFVNRVADRPNFDGSVGHAATRFIIASAHRPRYIHTFLPTIRQNEVDTWPIIHRIWREFPQITIAVSVTDPLSQTLTHYELTPETVLVENRWGILEPLPTAHCLPPTTFNIVLVPLLAFDMSGHRVGYGGGYYDRFLAECRSGCLKIGLSLFDPVDEITDVEPTDIRLDACVTPKHTHWFEPTVRNVTGYK